GRLIGERLFVNHQGDGDVAALGKRPSYPQDRGRYQRKEHHQHGDALRVSAHRPVRSATKALTWSARTSMATWLSPPSGTMMSACCLVGSTYRSCIGLTVVRY